MSAMMATVADPPVCGVPEPNPGLALVLPEPPEVDPDPELPDEQAASPAAPSATAPVVTAPRDRKDLRLNPLSSVTDIPHRVSTAPPHRMYRAYRASVALCHRRSSLWGHVTACRSFGPWL